MIQSHFMKRTFAVALAVMCAMGASAAKKYIFSSWELGDVTPQEILAHADEFDRAGCDGLSLGVRTLLPGANGQHHRHVMEEPRWRGGAALVRIPDGANNLYVLLDAGKNEKVRKVEFRDFEVFRIK